MPVSFSSNLETILSSPQEEVVLVIQKHPFTIIPRITITFLLSLFFGTIIVLFFTLVISSVSLLVSSLLVILSIAATVATTIMIDWFFDLYIITTQKILEVRYSPPFSFKTNSVLLDQVKVTEIDVRMNGITNEILNKGDIVITFDRPTHEEEFALTDIHDPRKKALFLSTALNGRVDSQPVMWYPIRRSSHMNTDKVFTYG